MTSFQSWRPIYRAICPEPGPRDVFLVVLVNGKRVSIQPVTDYERLRDALDTVAREKECHVKMLSMTGREFMNFSGITPREPRSIDDMDPAFHAQAVKNCTDLIEASVEPRERKEALDLLRKLGVLNA
ncbi:MAG: hypothetical protein ACXIT4_07945 [Erythrobacter sp.]